MMYNQLCVLHYASGMPASDTHSRLGRARRGVNVPQEYELAELLKDIDKPHSTWNTSKSACLWYGVLCEDGESVSSLFINDLDLTGSLDFTRLPRSLLSCHFSKHKLHGQVALDELPPGLLLLNVGSNKFSGHINLTNLPQTLKILTLADNLFEGKVDLGHLPPSMLRLKLDRNRMSGTVDLSHLPSRIRTVHLQGNSFAGCLALNTLPQSMEVLDCSNNCFSGVASFDHLPRSMKNLSVVDNADLEGEINESILPEKFETLEIHGTKIHPTNKHHTVYPS